MFKQYIHLIDQYIYIYIYVIQKQDAFVVFFNVCVCVLNHIILFPRKKCRHVCINPILFRIKCHTCTCTCTYAFHIHLKIFLTVAFIPFLIHQSITINFDCKHFFFHFTHFLISLFMKYKCYRLWCLMPLSTIIQLQHGVQFYW